MDFSPSVAEISCRASPSAVEGGAVPLLFAPFCLQKNLQLTNVANTILSNRKDLLCLMCKTAEVRTV